MSAEDDTRKELTEELDRLRQQVARLQQEKEQTLQSREKRLGELLALSAISQATAGETDLARLYRVIHAEIRRVMGEINFMIAHYDAARDIIEIPYVYEEGQELQIEPFPLGEGLTSILIRTRRPLLVVEDTENRFRALGAKLFGAPAKSWLGVPLIVVGEVIGAIIVQDLEHEHRFNEDDQRLLSTLAGQVAITIRHIRLLENARRQAERERLLKEISSKLMSSTDMDTILRTAIHELGRALRASEGIIQLEM
jgi:GAF domain-containing protein